MPRTPASAVLSGGETADSATQVRDQNHGARGQGRRGHRAGSPATESPRSGRPRGEPRRVSRRRAVPRRRKRGGPCCREHTRACVGAAGVAPEPHWAAPQPAPSVEGDVGSGEPDRRPPRAPTVPVVCVQGLQVALGDPRQLGQDVAEARGGGHVHAGLAALVVAVDEGGAPAVAQDEGAQGPVPALRTGGVGPVRRRRPCGGGRGPERRIPRGSTDGHRRWRLRG